MVETDKEAVYDIVKYFAAQDNTIVVSVSKSTDDGANDPSFNLIRLHHPKQDWICVHSKLDLLEVQPSLAYPSCLSTLRVHLNPCRIRSLAVSCTKQGKLVRGPFRGMIGVCSEFMFWMTCTVVHTVPQIPAHPHTHVYSHARQFAPLLTRSLPSNMHIASPCTTCTTAITIQPCERPRSQGGHPGACSTHPPAECE